MQVDNIPIGYERVFSGVVESDWLIAYYNETAEPIRAVHIGVILPSNQYAECRFYRPINPLDCACDKCKQLL